MDKGKEREVERKTERGQTEGEREVEIKRERERERKWLAAVFALLSLNLNPVIELPCDPFWARLQC